MIEFFFQINQILWIKVHQKTAAQVQIPWENMKVLNLLATYSLCHYMFDE